MYPNWLNQNIPNHILENKFLKIGFSQNGEDDFIRGYFWEKILRNEQLSYLDIGCFHDSLYSNTKLLSLAGWKGIAIDANPELKDIWESNRPLDTFLNYGITSNQSHSLVSKNERKLNFYRFKDGAINTFSKTLATDWVQKGFELRDIVQITCIDLTKLGEIINTLMPNFYPNFLSIDIEQVNYLSELREFISLMRRPELLCLEWINQGYNLNNYKESQEYKVLNECGYDILTLLGGNIFAERGR